MPVNTVEGLNAVDLIRNIFKRGCVITETEEKLAFVHVVVADDTVQGFNLYPYAIGGAQRAQFESISHNGEVLFVYPSLETTLRAIGQYALARIIGIRENGASFADYSW